jgi:hypothetical protein
MSLSARRIAAVDEERVTDHIACTRAAEPQHSCGDLLRRAETPNWFILQEFGQDLGITA